MLLIVSTCWGSADGGFLHLIENWLGLLDLVIKLFA